MTAMKDSSLRPVSSVGTGWALGGPLLSSGALRTRSQERGTLVATRTQSATAAHRGERQGCDSNLQLESGKMGWVFRRDPLLGGRQGKAPNPP